MRDRTKILLSIATFFVGAGLILFVVVMTVNKWDFTRLNTITYEAETHTIEEAFQNIELNTESADVRLERSADGTCRVEWSVPENWKHSVEVADNTLLITLRDDTSWYDHIGINVKPPKITVYLPEENYKLLTANMHSGKLDVPKNLKFIGVEVESGSADVECETSATGTLRITTSSGDVNLNEATATAIYVTTSSGHVTMESTTAGSITVATESGKPKLHAVHCNADLKIDVTSGDAYLSDISCSNLYTMGASGELTIDTAYIYEMLIIKRKSGDVTLRKCDVLHAISITTTSGDVTGNFDMPVTCYANSESGDIKTPKNDYGIYCEVNTGSGDIDISLSDTYEAQVTQALERNRLIVLTENQLSNTLSFVINQFITYRNKNARIMVVAKRIAPLSEIPPGQLIGGLGFDSDIPDENFTVRRKAYEAVDEYYSFIFDLDDILDTAASRNAENLRLIVDENSGFILYEAHMVYDD